MIKKIIFVVFVVLILGTVAFTWLNTPVHFLKDVKASSIVNIEVFDGNTGKKFSVDNKDNISHIVNNIQSASIKHDSISMFNSGYGFRISFYNNKGTLVDEFIINSDNIIRDDPFFYIDKNFSLCFDYLKGLEKQSK